nr:MAG TPA: hypothetical protein [Caudoviricetes sp.]
MEQNRYVHHPFGFVLYIFLLWAYTLLYIPRPSLWVYVLISFQSFIILLSSNILMDWHTWFSIKMYFTSAVRTDDSVGIIFYIHIINKEITNLASNNICYFL